MKKISKWALGKARAGISIMLSTVMISVVVLFSVGVTVLVTDSVRQSNNVKQGTTAYYSAEAGLEQALWVNQKLASTGDSIGANEGGNGEVGSASAKFKIQGSTQNLKEKTVNGKYIVPFPWTGNAPWHGEGAIAGSGGCSPEKPPLRTGTGSGKQFTFKYLGTNLTLDEQYHPCNWNMIKLGEKASIPLFSKDNTTGIIHKFTAFTLRVRTPCKEGGEMCQHSDRLTLNCFDKGDVIVKCKAADTSANKQWGKGDVMMAWQIDGEKVGGVVNSLLPKAKPKASGYDLTFDAQLFEGRVNDARDTGAIWTTGAPTGDYFEALNELMSGLIDGDSTQESTINAFLNDINLTEPILKLSVVTELTHCDSKNGLCDNTNDNPSNVNYKKHNVPYLEYQIILPSDAASNFPASMNNVITAEGSSGPFNQSIQVKVPNDNSTLEYVIQQ